MQALLPWQPLSFNPSVLAVGKPVALWSAGWSPKKSLSALSPKFTELNLLKHTQEARPPTFLQDLGQIIAHFSQAAFDTIKSIPIVIGIDLLPEETGEAQSTNLMTAIRQGFDHSSNGHGALAGLAFMIFVLIYTPCMASLAAERQELGTRWMWVSIIGSIKPRLAGIFPRFSGRAAARFRVKSC